MHSSQLKLAAVNEIKEKVKQYPLINPFYFKGYLILTDLKMWILFPICVSTFQSGQIFFNVLIICNSFIENLPVTKGHS